MTEEGNGAGSQKEEKHENSETKTRAGEKMGEKITVDGPFFGDRVTIDKH